MNPKAWPGQIAVLLGIALALVAGGALLPEAFRTVVMEWFTPGEVVAVASLALWANVALVCAALYRVAKLFPAVSPRHTAMTGLALLSLIFVLSMSYWTLSARSEGCMKEPLTKVDALYFTLTTLTTTGFGDIQPWTQVCRGLVSEQLVAGFIVITFIIGILVSRAASSLPPSAE